MSSLLALDRGQWAPQSFCLNDAASKNILFMLTTLDTTQVERSRLNTLASRNMPPMLVTLDTFHLERSPLNDFALMNMRNIMVTLDTSHLDMSPLNEFVLVNKPLVSVALETSHPAIGPCGPLGQSPLGDNFRHASTASLSSDWDTMRDDLRSALGVALARS